MATEDERCAEATKFRQIDEAFRNGDLEGLRAAVDDPAVVPNGRMPDTMACALVGRGVWRSRPFWRTAIVEFQG